MPGILQYSGTKPKVGDSIFIVVSSSNRPSGLWRGELTEVGDDYRSSETNKEKSCRCRAKITGMIEPENPFVEENQHLGTEPTENYRCLTMPFMLEEILRRRVEDRKEISGLKRRLEIVTSTFHGALRAMVSDEAAARFEELATRLIAAISSK